MNRPIRDGIIKILLSGIVLLMGGSCSSTKRMIKEPLKEQGAEYLFENLKQNELKYNFFSARFSAGFRQNKIRNSFSGQIRIHKDSLIWISISPALGIEMARVLISNDSVKYMNRIDNTYFISDFNYINSLINSTLDFDMLQAFLTGNDFSFYENSSFKASIDNREYKLVTTERRKLKKYLRHNQNISIPLQNIWLNPDNFKITRVLIKEVNQNGRKLEGRYKYQTANGQLVPSHLNFQLETAENINAIEIEVDYTKVNTGETLQFPFRIPEKYNRVNKF